ncbi:aldehyde ferredoxin oxidoreductase N-terminal domain-containing protein [Megalodesulfovibrio paquesii]
MGSNMFRVLHVRMDQGKGQVLEVAGRAEHLGGCGLAALLYQQFGDLSLPALDPSQPLIFAIGPLTGWFPLMSKTVCGFKSPYTEEYAESHAGGRLGLSLRFSGLDALVITGAAPRLTCLVTGANRVEFQDVSFMQGMDVFTTGKHLRRYGKSNAGHRSTLRIGPAGENRSAFACINVDTFRHFGRLGAGAVMGAKNLKGIIVAGNKSLPLPASKDYPKLYKDIHSVLTDTDMMRKYHDLGTPINMAVLNGLRALPWRNLQATSDEGAIDGVSGECFAEQLLLRKTACAGCPVGCIHIGLLRQLFAEDHNYLYKQVGYDHETVFANGSMLGMTKAWKILVLLDEAEKQGLDAISSGVALAWATEAFEKGLITERETLVPLKWDDVESYRLACVHLSLASNDFYRHLAQGALKAAAVYGGAEFACVLGQEMAGYATGENFFISQAMGFRYSHLDAAGYSYDQKTQDKDTEKAVDFLIQDEKARVMLNSLVSCLFARSAYTEERIHAALLATDQPELAENLDASVEAIRRTRWRLKLQSGYQPEQVRLPKRFLEIETWKGKMDPSYVTALRDLYARKIREMGA